MFTLVVFALLVAQKALALPIQHDQTPSGASSSQYLYIVVPAIAIGLALSFFRWHTRKETQPIKLDDASLPAPPEEQQGQILSTSVEMQSLEQGFLSIKCKSVTEIEIQESSIEDGAAHTSSKRFVRRGSMQVKGVAREINTDGPRQNPFIAGHSVGDRNRERPEVKRPSLIGTGLLEKRPAGEYRDQVTKPEGVRKEIN